MERIMVGGVPVAAIFFGVSSVVWPAWAVLKSRDDDDRSPPTAGEIWFMRAVGVFAVLIGVFGLYDILTGMAGAEGPPLP